MRATVFKRNFLQDITGIITDITVYISGQKGEKLVNPDTDVRLTIDIKFCKNVQYRPYNRVIMGQVNNMEIDFINKRFYLPKDRLDRLSSYAQNHELEAIEAINNAKNLKEVWDVITNIGDNIGKKG